MTRAWRAAPYLASMALGCGFALLGPRLLPVLPSTAVLAGLMTTGLFCLLTLLWRLAAEGRAASEALAVMAARVAALEDQVAAADASPGDIRLALARLVSALEQRPTPDATVAAGDAPEMSTHVRDALMHDRVDVHLQPIVQFPTRATAHYEAFSRLRDADGRVIMPSEFVPAAGAAGLAGPLDSFQLARCIAIAKRLDAQGVAARLFCNIAGPALADASFRCELIRYLETHAELASHIVLEFGARDLIELGADSQAALVGLARSGYRFSVDHVAPAVVSDALAVLPGLAFAKIDADALIAADDGFIAGCAMRGVEIVATRVESERQVIELLDRGVNFGQGFLFGQPRPARLASDGKRSRAA